MDQDTPSQDPAGIIAYFNTVVPQAPKAVRTSSPSSAGVTLAVDLARYAGFLRAKIDGTWITGQDYTIKREEGESMSTGGTTGVSTVSFAITGQSLASGSHSVTVYAISRDGSKIETTGVTAAFTV
jgi:hypothetical protein